MSPPPNGDYSGLLLGRRNGVVLQLRGDCAGAPVAGRDAAPILLVAPNTLPESIAAELTRLKPAKIVILGGVNSVSPELLPGADALSTSSFRGLPTIRG
ncbi:cell wall-binding repeat-containing protein [Glaciihabitans tibetensis]|uniref:cell wall-binding repeat-containing protein n=1 Tax=Glaciihabitans tibetensis TaxID=1266600 RepID=UPI0015E74E2A